MLKRTLFGLSLAALATTTFSEGDIGCPFVLELCDGYYVGVGIGVANLNLNTTITGSILNSNRFGYTGVATDLHGGYSWNFKDIWNIGLEGFFNYMDIDTGISSANNTANASYKTNWIIGAKLLPALQFSASTRIFGALGLAWTYAKFYSSPLAQTTAGVAASYVKTAPGIVLGAGIDTAVNNALSVRGEYDYVAASHWGVGATANGNTINYSFKRHTNVAIMSLNYHMCC